MTETLFPSDNPPNGVNNAATSSETPNSSTPGAVEMPGVSVPEASSTPPSSVVTETPVSPESSGADLSAYENIDLSQLNAVAEDPKAGEKKLEFYLVKTIFYGKIATWIGLGLLIIIGLYSYTRHQSQSSWLINMPLSTRDSIICSWMNRGNQDALRRDGAFVEYLNKEGQQSLVDLDSSGKCLASDTIATWLDYEYRFYVLELGRAYEKIIPKKFLGVTIDASPEFEIIAKNAPRNRVDHADLVGIISGVIDEIGDTTTRVTCDKISFVNLNADLSCSVMTKSPTQPRKKALEFMENLEKTGSMLVTYPTTLDMSVEKDSQFLTTKFTAKLTYIPARYEAETLEKITYDKR